MIGQSMKFVGPTREGGVLGRPTHFPILTNICLIILGYIFWYPDFITSNFQTVADSFS